MIQGETDWLSLFDSFSSRKLYDFFDLRLRHKENSYPMMVVATDKDEFNLYIFDSSYENIHINRHCKLNWFKRQSIGADFFLFIQ